jgi:hypothetical protein
VDVLEFEYSASKYFLNALLELLAELQLFDVSFIILLITALLGFANSLTLSNFSAAYSYTADALIHQKLTFF